jgi:hypothetical protein
MPLRLRLDISRRIESDGGVTAALGVTKDLLAVNKLVSEAEFKLKIAELNTALAAAQSGLVDVQKTLSERDKEIAELKASFALKETLIEVRGFKYREKGGRPVGGAFCPLCELEDGRFMPLTMSAKHGRIFVCPRCKSEYNRGPTFYNETK